MRYEDWNNGLNQIDMSFIEEYIDEKRKYKKKKDFKALIGRISAAAACIAVILTVIIAPTQISTFTPPAYEDALYTANEIAYILNKETYGGLTKAYDEVFVPDEKYLNIDPIPDLEYIEIYKLTRKKKAVNISEFKAFADSFLAKLVSALSKGTAVPQYNIREFSDNMWFSVNVNGYNIHVGQHEGYNSASVSGYDIVYLNGNMIQVDQRLSDDEILESLEPIKKDLFEIFGVNYDKARIVRTYNDEQSDAKTGLLGLDVYFYKENEYGDRIEYIELDFLNTNGYPGVVPSEDYLRYCRVGFLKSRTEKEREVIAEAKMLSLKEAEKLLYNGYVFGGHSCRICMSEQKAISFRNYDYVGIKYVYGYKDASRTMLIGIPVYVFYKEIGIGENGNKIFAVTDVPAIEVSGLQEYFENQKANHK